MNTPNLSLLYTGPAVPDDPWWIAIEQLPVTDDVATIAETAALLDTSYRIEACSVVEPEPVDVDPADIALAAESTFDLAICGRDHDGAVELQVKVIRSRAAEPYRLHVAGGSVLASTVVQAETVQVVTLAGAESVTLPYPVIDGFAVAWRADAVPASGALPTINRTGNTLYWSGQVTGSLRATYLTTYDLVTLRVNGIDGEQGHATLRVVYHGLVEDLVPALPDPSETDRTLCPSTRWQVDPDGDEVTCYKAVTVRQLCGCSKTEVDTTTRDQVVPCPEGGPTRCPGNSRRCMHLLGSETVEEYVDCSGDNGIPGRPNEVYAVSDPEWYKDKCCEYPTVQLPQCPELTESYPGGQAIERGEAYYRAMYGEGCRFVPVTPEGGTCGKHITRQIIEPEECCDQITPLTWDADNSIDTMVADDSGFVYVLDGLGPFTWHISSPGGGIWFVASGGSDLVTEQRFAELVSWSNNVCGEFTITCTDSCDTVVTGYINGLSGGWVVRMNGTDQWWDMDDFLAATGKTLPLLPYKSIAFVELDPEVYGGWYPATHLVQVIRTEGDHDVRYEQPVGVAEYSVVRDTGVLSAEYLCKLTIDGPVAGAAEFPLPETIPTDIWPTDAQVSFYNANISITPTISIWQDGAGPGGYDADTRRALYRFSWPVAVSQGVYEPGYSLHYQTGDEEVVWGYASKAGGSGCCAEGYTCYQGFFSYRHHLQQVRIYDWVC